MFDLEMPTLCTVSLTCGILAVLVRLDDHDHQQSTATKAHGHRIQCILSIVHLNGHFSLKIYTHCDGGDSVSLTLYLPPNFLNGVVSHSLLMATCLLSLTRAGEYQMVLTDSFQPTQSSVLGNIAIEDEMHFELDVVIHSFPSSTWENFFVCCVLYNCLYSHLCSRCASL